MSDPVSGYVGGLPEAAGIFTGTYDPGPDLMPVEIDTYDEPNPVAQYQPGGTLRINMDGREWAFPIDYAEPLGGNRVRVWVRRPA